MNMSAQDVAPDPERIRALQEAAPPASKKEVMSFLYMVQSFSEFIPTLSRRTTHLRELTQKNVRFSWSRQCQSEFEDLRSAIREGITLNHFQVGKPMYIYVDAHKSGLSAMLAQGDKAHSSKIVACASRATTPVERRYPQLDLEAPAIDFALRRYRQHLVGGCPVTIITDHKPLVSVLGSTTTGSILTDRIQLRHQNTYKVE